MKHCAGLDVSVKETAICIVDETGKIVREAKVTTEPEAIVTLLMEAGFEYARIGLEAGPMSQWLVTDLLEAGCKRRSKDPSLKRPGGPVAPE